MINKFGKNDWLVVFSLIASSGCVFSVLGIDKIIAPFLFIIVLILTRKANLFRNKNFCICFLKILFTLVILFLLHSLNIDSISTFLNINDLSIFLLFATTILVSFYFYRRQNFIFILNKVLFIFVIHGVLSFFVLAVFPTQNVLFTTIDGGSKYLGYLYLFFQRTHVDYFSFLDPTYIDFFGYKLQRAHGMAWEPGNFAIYANIFVFLNLFIFKKIKYVVLGLFAILITFSTSGIILLIFQFLWYFLRNLKEVFTARFLLLKLTLLIILVPVLFVFTSNNINEKIYGEKSGSGAARFLNTYVLIEAIKNNPIIGSGFYIVNYKKNINSYLKISKAKLGNFLDVGNQNTFASTNSFLRLFSQMGIPIGLFLSYCIFKQSLIPNNKILFGFLMIFSLSSQPLMFSPFFFMFVSSGILSVLGFKKK